MMQIRLAEHRGRANLGWLDSRHTFSFADYYDPEFMGFGPLRVVNEDRVQPGRGFGAHAHRDMEIISYVLEGALEHSDSLGTGSVIRPGSVQRMSAGTGVTHSEFNHSKSEIVHFLQIWIIPERQGLEPSYDEKTFADDEKRDRLRLVASRDGRSGSVRVHCDVELYCSLLSAGGSLTHTTRPDRKYWLQMARGTATVNGKELHPGDGAAMTDEPRIEIEAMLDTELLLFDMQ
jgi:redox-sensitive bicupin YhaK (pirin superfamily)